MGRNFLIPDEDLAIIKELAKTLSVAEIAEKWDTTQMTVLKFLKRHKCSAKNIRRQHRLEFINDHPEYDIHDFVLKFNMSYSHVQVLRRHARKVKIQEKVKCSEILP